MVYSILLLLLCFALLVLASDYFVNAAASLARHLKVSDLVIGLTIVAAGTSLPEAAVSLSAAITGKANISVGNIIGSNLFDILVVVGMSAILSGSIVVSQEVISRHIPFNIIITCLIYIVLMDFKISRLEGIFLLLILFCYFISIAGPSRNNHSSDQPLYSLPLSILIMLFSLAVIIVSGKYAVEAASSIAILSGLSDTFISLTIVAVGTSLPELTTSCIAARKKNPEIALGNAVGSCIFNILFIVGASATISPMASLSANLLTDTGLLLIVSSLLLLTVKKGRINILDGLIWMGAYGLYLYHCISTARL